MSAIIKAIVSLLAITTTASAGWIASVLPDDSGFPGTARIQYSAEKSEGNATLVGALVQLVRQGSPLDRLKTVAIYPFLQEADFQKEIFSTLERRAPKLLHEALQSPGDQDNPKIRSLYKPFIDAVLASTRVKQISGELLGYRLKVAGATGKNFMLRKEKDQPQFLCDLILEIEQIPERISKRRIRDPNLIAHIDHGNTHFSVELAHSSDETFLRIRIPEKQGAENTLGTSLRARVVFQDNSVIEGAPKPALGLGSGGWIGHNYHLHLKNGTSVDDIVSVTLWIGKESYVVYRF